LPEIKLSWWNTQTKKIETATLAATTLSVSGTVTQLPHAQAPITTLPETVSNAANGIQINNPLTATNNNQWKWLSVALATGWFLTIIYLLFTANKKPGRPVKTSQLTMQSLSNVEKSVLQACNVARKQGEQIKFEQHENIKNTLLDWAQVRWQNQHITSLTQLASYCPTELAREVQNLNQVLYTPASHETNNINNDIKALSTAFKVFKSDKNTVMINENSVLEPLYKT